MRISIRTILLFFVSSIFAAQPSEYFQIEVVDDQTGRGVPLVELRTVNQVRFWTDSNGIIAFNEPGMMDREVFFQVQSDGYSVPEDFFKQRGVRLKPKAGGHAKIKIQRVDIAERLYRITGEGIYRDSILTGRKVPLQEPLLNGEVTGQDTVITAIYRGKLYWFWGDTDRLSYPLGNFSGTGATSEFPGKGGLDPSLGVNLTYFTNKDGFAKAMCPNFGPGLQWVESAFTVKDPTGRERLVARVSSQEGLKPAYAWHFAVWNDEKEHFESLVKWDIKLGHDAAHSFRALIGGQEYIYLYPNYRVRAEWHSVTNLSSYEAFTCLNEDGKANRDETGRLQWKWLPGAERLLPGVTRKLIREGVIRREESWIQTDAEINRGSVAWNDYRKRWIMIGWGKVGEVCYSEAKAPTGPWVHAVRVTHHPAYSFYNPTQHPYFDQNGGRTIYFEGTYTAEFSAAREKTPRYNYNQIMYRLDLSDSRLRLPESDATLSGADAAVIPIK
jgi:hypothetical protein